jgi:hypothetical protein
MALMEVSKAYLFQVPIRLISPCVTSLSNIKKKDKLTMQQRPFQDSYQDGATETPFCKHE